MGLASKLGVNNNKTDQQLAGARAPVSEAG